MKTLIALAIGLSVLFYASVSFSESDEICCTWINAKYDAGRPPQKIMFHYDGTYATYNTSRSNTALTRGMFQIVEKWSDSDGYVWYKILMRDPTQDRMYKLAKVSDDGKQLEFVCQPDTYPVEIKADGSGYCTYQRASMDYDTLP